MSREGQKCDRGGGKPYLGFQYGGGKGRPAGGRDLQARQVLLLCGRLDAPVDLRQPPFQRRLHGLRTFGTKLQPEALKHRMAGKALKPCPPASDGMDGVTSFL